MMKKRSIIFLKREENPGKLARNNLANLADEKS